MHYFTNLQIFKRIILRIYHCKIKTLFAYLVADVIHKPPRIVSGAVGFTPSV